MTNRERERRTLNFEPPLGRGSVEETFYPWSLTRDRYKKEGIPAEIADGANDITNDVSSAKVNQAEKYLPAAWGEGVMRYEEYLGFDPVRRIHFVLPFRRFEEKILEDAPNYVIRQDIFGRQMRREKNSDIEIECRPVISSQADWERLKEHAEKELAAYFTDEAIQKAYSPVVEGQRRGDYPVRLNIEGFFWVPRELMGIEAHLLAFIKNPELIHSINSYVLDVYLRYLSKVMDVVVPDLVYIMEDLSGKNGPMISPKMFDKFVGAYYQKLIPMLRAKGVANIFVDTDGRFDKLIPNFMAAGVDGFLPMDVNAGMDIVQVRRDYPTLKFIGGFDKLRIAEGKEAIDAEFQRILPVVREGGYVVGADHQVAPSASLENYKYYITRLKSVMAQAGADKR